jgi:DNA-binding Lrp family transcriptional regulator
MSVDDLHGELLAHLHANSHTTPEQLAGMLGVSTEAVRAALDELLAAGHLERQGDRLVPDAASHPTPGLFVANERRDAEAVEVDYTDDERDDG